MKSFVYKRKHSIREELIIPLIISFLLVMSLMTWILISQSQKMVENVLEELRSEMVMLIDRDLDARIGEAIQLNSINFKAMQNGILDVSDSKNRERYFSTMLNYFPDVAMNYVGFNDGTFYGARRLVDGSIEVGKNNEETQGHSEYYSINQYGDAMALTQVFENFDPRMRPWYQDAVASGKITFSPIYSHFLFKEPTITVSIPYYEDSELISVFGVDFLLTWLAQSLAELPFGENGLVFILNEEGQLVANTSGGGLDNPIILEILKSSLIDGETKDLLLNYENDIYMVAKSLYHYENIDWDIYVVLRRDDFLSDLNQTLVVTLGIVFLISALFILVMVLMIKRIVNPIKRLNEATKQLEQGVFVELENDNNNNELHELTHSFSEMGRRIIHQVEILESEVEQRTQELEQKNKILSELSYTDQLTHIANRRKFDDSARLMYELAKRSSASIGILMIDIDDFKAFNDTYGHLEGDECLKSIAHGMENCVHRQTDLLARYGGEEFVVVMMYLTKEQFAQRAECLRKTVEGLGIINKHTERGIVTISLGVTYGKATQEKTIEELVDKADQALYRAKESGKNRCEIIEF
jgi:diguanylate cyclase (GGDEF)-like protein